MDTDSQYMYITDANSANEPLKQETQLPFTAPLSSWPFGFREKKYFIQLSLMSEQFGP